MIVIVGSRETNDGSRDTEDDERNCSEPMREILDQSEDESILIIKIISICNFEIEIMI